MNKPIHYTIALEILVLLITCILYGWLVKDRADHLVVVAQEPVMTPTPIPSDIVGYINYKFGSDAWKALKVLSCENKTLNPEALNDNTLWGGVGKDRGFWQINNVFHPSVSDACAKDVKCSTDYAYRMYKNDNYRFTRWTCGKNLNL